MSDPGLSHRLRQRSRRAGLMIGISMVLTIALCAVGFTVIYTALDGFTSDFVSSSEDDDTPTAVEQVAENNPDEDDSQPTEPAESEVSQETENEEPDPTPTPPPDDNNEDAAGDEGNGNEDEDEDDENGFDPDYQLQGVTVNLRSGPSTSTSVVSALPPATPLEYLDEDAPTDSPSDGERWMRFATEDGLEGWIREIDVTEFEP